MRFLKVTTVKTRNSKRNVKITVVQQKERIKEKAGKIRLKKNRLEE